MLVVFCGQQRSAYTTEPQQYPPTILCPNNLVAKIPIPARWYWIRDLFKVTPLFQISWPGRRPHPLYRTPPLLFRPLWLQMCLLHLRPPGVVEAVGKGVHNVSNRILCRTQPARAFHNSFFRLAWTPSIAHANAFDEACTSAYRTMSDS